MIPQAEEAYGGSPARIPGSIEAEEFDLGGEGIGYSDVDDSNVGGVSYALATTLNRSAVIFNAYSMRRNKQDAIS